MNLSCDSLTPFFLGELSDDEVSAFYEHVQNCDNCRAELDALMDINDSLISFEEECHVSLPPDLKEKTLQRAFAARPPVKPRKKRVWHFSIYQASVQTSVVAASALILGIAIGRFTNMPVSSPKPASGAPAQMLNEISLIPVTANTQATGFAMVYQKNEKRDLVVYVNRLKPIDSYECYSVWVTTNQGQRRNYGDFTVDKSGNAVIAVTLPPQLSTISIEITLEPSWNDPRPLGPQVLVPALKQT